MSTFKAAQDAFDNQLSQITAQIAQLEKDRIDIRRRRNEAAPVSQLPPELLLKIFSDCTSALTDDELRYIVGGNDARTKIFAKDQGRVRSAYSKLPYPNILRISHVCHAWRTVAAGTPQLWTRIQAQPRTHPEVVRLMQNKAGQHPLQLAYIGPPYWEASGSHPNSRSLEAIRHIFQSSFRAIKTIAVYASRRLAVDILSSASGAADDLESLILALPSSRSDGSFSTRFLLNDSANTILEGKTPNLRHLSVTGLVIPWKSPLLGCSPGLTELVLHDTQPATCDTLAELLSFLRRHRTLERLNLTLPTPDSSGDETHLLQKWDASADISLPNLEDFSIISEVPAPISAILSAIRVPKVIPSLILTVKAKSRASASTIALSERLFDRICQVISGGRDVKDFIAPDNIEIEPEWAKCSYSRTDGRKGVTKVSAFTPREPDASNITTAFQLPWSYNNLKSITINVPSSAVPESFWPVLARVDGLEVIKMSAENPHAFLTALRTDYDKPLEQASPNPGEVLTFSWTRRSFPALRAIRFISVSEGLRWYARQAGDQAALKVAEHIQTFFKDIVDALRRRHGSILEEVAFSGCAFGPKDPQATLKPLLTVTRIARWEGLNLKSNGLLYHGSKLVSDVKEKPALTTPMTSRMRKLRIK